MATHSPENVLDAAITRLSNERAGLNARVAEIDAVFARLGIKAASIAAPVVIATPAVPQKRRGRPPKAKPVAEVKPAGKKRGKRKTFAISGAESVIAFVRQAGETDAAAVNAQWVKEGRSGNAANMLSLAVKAGKVKRIEVPGQRAGRYKIA